MREQGAWSSTYYRDKRMRQRRRRETILVSCLREETQSLGGGQSRRSVAQSAGIEKGGSRQREESARTRSNLRVCPCVFRAGQRGCGQGQFAQRSGCAEAAEAEDDSVAPTRFSAQRFRPPRSPTVLAAHGRTLRRTLATPPALVTVLPLSLNIRVNIHALCSPWAAASRSRIAVYV